MQKNNEFKLNLDNFQSITEGELTFTKGLNFIIGQSNSGKSATFRAIKACLLNPTGSQRYIKKGATSASISIDYNNNKIFWKKSLKENSYIINGKEYLKTGRNNALNLIGDTSGFVSDETNDYLMNIEEELQLPFPFGISKAELFKLFENVFCVSDSAVILKSAKDHEDKVKADCKLLELDIQKNENKLQAIKELKEEIDINALKEYLRFFKAKNDRLTLLKDGLDIIKKVIKVSSLDLPDLDINFDNKIVQYKELIYLKKLIIRLKNLHKLIKEVPNYNKDNLLPNYLKYKELMNSYNKVKQLEKINIPEYSFENKLSKYIELKNYLSDLKQIKKNIKGLQEKLTYKQGYLEGLQEKLKEFKVCPLCHRKLE